MPLSLFAHKKSACEGMGNFLGSQRVDIIYERTISFFSIVYIMKYSWKNDAMKEWKFKKKFLKTCGDKK